MWWSHTWERALMDQTDDYLRKPGSFEGKGQQERACGSFSSLGPYWLLFNFFPIKQKRSFVSSLSFPHLHVRLRPRKFAQPIIWPTGTRLTLLAELTKPPH